LLYFNAASMGKSSRIRELEEEVRRLEGEVEELEDECDGADHNDDCVETAGREIKRLRASINSHDERLEDLEQEPSYSNLYLWLRELTHKLRETDATINCRCEECAVPPFKSC
jgi:predicted RNase H-like nuclease (RuvC/YqgF family)